MSDPKGGHGLEGRLRTLLAALALLGAMLPSAECQQTAGALAGRLTDIHSRPLDGVTVTLKNALSGTEVRTVTGKGGAYRFRDLAPGEYQLVAVNPQLGTGTVGGIQVLAGHESRVQTAVAMVREEESLTTAHTGRADTGAVQPVPPSSSTAPELGTRAEAPVASSAAPAGRVSPETPVIVGLPARAVDSTTLTARVAEPVSPVGNPLTLPIIPSVAGRASGALMAAMAVSADRAALMATPPEIDLARASNVTEVETIITSEQLEAIPLPGRRWENFVLDTPATEVEGDEADSAPGHPAREDSSLSVEGTSARMAFGGRVRGEAGRPLLGAGAMESAVQEFRVAELGNKALTGEGIELQTRKGAAGFHGQVFLFDRQKLWGAQNPFTQWVKETAPGTQTTTPAFTPFPYSPADTENRWGAGVGGQLRWHRLQWFTAIDGNRRNHPAVSTVKHPENFFAQPSNDEMQVLSARLGLSGANPVAEGLQAYSGMLESLAELLGPAPRTSQTWSGFGRLDWRAGERHRFTLQGSEATWNSPGGGLARASETFGTHSFGSSDGSSNWALARWETEIAPHLMAVTQGSMRRAIVETPAEAPASFEQGFLTNAWRQLPQMVVDSRYGFTIGNPSRFGPGSLPDEQVYEAQQRIDWVRRPLGFRAGLDFRHSADATSMLRNHTGTYSYSSVENFVSDALVFGKFGLSDSLDPMHQHNCDQRGKAWRDTAGQLHGLGYLPCYSHYTQTLGPTDWHLSTNDWAGFASLQWHPAKQLVMTAGVRWDREDLPPPIALVNNPDLPLTQRLPLLQNAWSPRVGLALGHDESHWPVLRLGYGIFAGRTNNGMLETALTQTGSPKGDLKFLMRPTDNLQGNAGGAPPFPYVLGGEPGSAVKPAAVEFAPGFHNPEIHQGAVEMDQRLPGRILITLGAMVSLAPAGDDGYELRCRLESENDHLCGGGWNGQGADQNSTDHRSVFRDVAW